VIAFFVTSRYEMSSLRSFGGYQLRLFLLIGSSIHPSITEIRPDDGDAAAMRGAGWRSVCMGPYTASVFTSLSVWGGRGGMRREGQVVKESSRVRGSQEGD
jgi:hypothetical protein